MSRHYHGTLRIVLGKSLTYLMIYAVMATYMLCLVPKMFSLVQNSSSRNPSGIHVSLYTGMHLFRDDLFYLYSPSGSLYDDLCIYLSTVAIYLRHFVARYCHS